jgi:hypothetical protein
MCGMAYHVTEPTTVLPIRGIDRKIPVVEPEARRGGDTDAWLTDSQWLAGLPACWNDRPGWSWWRPS